MIGGSWAALFLSKGLRVLLSDPAPGAKGRFEAYLDAAWATLEALGLPNGACKTNYEMVDNLLPYLNEVDFIQEVCYAVFFTGAGVCYINTKTLHPSRMGLNIETSRPN